MTYPKRFLVEIMFKAVIAQKEIFVIIFTKTKLKILVKNKDQYHVLLLEIQIFVLKEIIVLISILK